MNKKKTIVQINVTNGRFQVNTSNRWYSYWRDPYHLMLNISWVGFFVFIAFGYVITNAIFAIAYLLQPDSLQNAKSGSFLDAFFFSVQTLATIGYGAVYPKTIYANIIVTLEALIGLIGVAIMTGLAFARFTKATAKVVFSRFAVIAPHNGLPTLMFRAANKRSNQILEAMMQVYLMRDEITEEGNLMRRFHSIKLLRNQTPAFGLSWTAMHTIDESSPLYRASAESLAKSKTMIVISLTGIDETVAQAMYARHYYAPGDILWNHKFVDIFSDGHDGNRYLDYSKFHHVEEIVQA